MAQVTFEYTDSSGHTHRVGSMKQVPKKYMKTMTAVGKLEEQQPAGGKSRTTTQQSVSRTEIQGIELPQALQGLNWNFIIPVVAVILLMRFKNFMARCLIIVAAFTWAFYTFYTWFEGSNYARSGKKIERKAEPKQPEMIVPRFDGGGR